MLERRCARFPSSQWPARQALSAGSLRANLRQPARTVKQIPIARRTFPLVKRAATCGAQKCALHINQGQVKSRRMGSFADSPGATRSGNEGPTPMHHYFARFTNQLWWPRKIPHRNLSGCWNIGKRRPIQATPAPLCTRFRNSISIKSQGGGKSSKYSISPVHATCSRTAHLSPKVQATR